MGAVYGPGLGVARRAPEPARATITGIAGTAGIDVTDVTWTTRRAATAQAASDEELLDRFVRGEATAFGEILERYRDKVYQFACWTLDSRSEAEDATQEVFFQLFRSARSFRHRSKFRTWLYSLARNVCRQHAAKLRRRPVTPWREDDAGEGGFEIPDGRPGALDRLEEEERQQLLRGAVERLPPHHRTVLLLRDWEDLAYDEIAAVLRVPVGTVRSRLFHARGALARQLAGYFENAVERGTAGGKGYEL
jgi:RNA polymerase sigma-70 factor (ECF subfamily)